MTRNPRTRLLRAVSLVALLHGARAGAVELELTPPTPSLPGDTVEFAVALSNPVGEVELRWSLGDGTETEFAVDATSISHTFEAVGHYAVTVVATDDEGFTSRTFQHVVHRPLTPKVARASTSLLLDERRGLVITTNVENGTLSLVDVATFAKVAEIPVFSNPVALALAPDERLWVVDRENYAIAIVDLDARKAVEFFRLPYASQPVGLVFSPDGRALVPLLALGEVVSIDAATHEVLTRKFVGPMPRGLTLSGDGTTLWVTRFLSRGDHGEVYRLDAQTLEVVGRYDLMEDTTTEDSTVQGRGLPNYLFSVHVSPDGSQAWVPAKKDNMSRGLMRDGLANTQDNAVRPLVSILDLTTHEEVVSSRIDFDNRNLPRQVTFSPLGDYAFVALFGSNMIEVRDAYSRALITSFRGETLKGPVDSVLDSEGRLYVLADASRSLSVFDVSAILDGTDQGTRLVTSIPLVETDKLSPEVLRGKQIFESAEDLRMTLEGYQSCASCHFEGFEDGRVWDFFDRGEGFRNTTSLLGRRGTGHGRVHWSANFDEIQDFEGPIRVHQGGSGFLTEEEFAMGTRSDPLGDPKAGVNSDLDALAAYVTSFESIPRSPHRKADGTLTDAAEAGRVLFLELGCDSCHAGDDFTDSALGELHDVGTLTELSGKRLGGDLPGIDTPTLLGIWQTAPYLHDGSAATLRDVLTTRNVGGKHGNTAPLSDEQLDQLVAYLEQIDQGLPPVELSLPGATNDGGEGGAGGSSGVDDGGEPNPTSGCSCDLAQRSTESSRNGTLLGLITLAGLGLLRRRRTTVS